MSEQNPGWKNPRKISVFSTLGGPPGPQGFPHLEVCGGRGLIYTTARHLPTTDL